MPTDANIGHMNAHAPASVVRLEQTQTRARSPQIGKCEGGLPYPIWPMRVYVYLKGIDWCLLFIFFSLSSLRRFMHPWWTKLNDGYWLYTATTAPFLETADQHIYWLWPLWNAAKSIKSNTYECIVVFFFYSPVHTAHAKRANNTGTPPVVLQRTAKTPETNLMTHRVCDVRKLSEYQYVHAFALVNARNVLVDAYTPATRWRMMKNKRDGKSRIKYTRKQMLVVVVADWEIMKRGSCCKTMRQKRNRINRRERMGEKININGTNIHGMHECILCAHAMHRTKNLYKATYMWPSSAIAFCWVYSTIGVWEIIIIYMHTVHTHGYIPSESRYVKAV